MRTIDEIIKNQTEEKRICGEIIDDRSMNGIPFDTYVQKYKECERLLEVLIAERDGRCVVLPCKVGDTVYKLWYEPCHNGEDRPDGMGCAGCIDECDIKRAVVPFTANSVEHIVGMRNSLNRFWFLTREEAEAALKEGGEKE